MTERMPTALTIAGSDPSGGAGIQADLKTFAALGIYGASVITALTAQNTTGVFGVHGVPQEFIVAQFDAVIADLDVRAIKTGMLGDAATVLTVVDCLKRVPNIAAIIDPVMVATSGDVLLAEDAIAVVRESLLPLATVLTPNLPEAAKLLGAPVAANEHEAAAQGRALVALGAKSVLIKGGHGEGDEAVDLLVSDSAVTRFARQRIATKNTHGTGCTLSAAIAAGLADGRSLIEAVSAANEFVWRALASGAEHNVGRGRGPIDHGFAMRDQARKR
ncbi:MAG: bifunctional hydroxymethylpyrimidine kinase/phosphomethylpyrimidine kinase [Hyphomicrobium sp.]